MGIRLRLLFVVPFAIPVLFAVQTASANQVRQEIYGTAVGRWKHYEKHLQPLLEAIGDS